MRMLSLAALALLCAGAWDPAHAQPAPPQAGTDYIEIPNGRPLDPAEGMIVVEEYFNYICPACNSFEPLFVAWTRQLPPYVKVQHVPATFRADFVPYARAYYAAQALGLAERTHQAVYDAIHRQRKLPAEGDKPDEQKIAEFYAGFGVEAPKFLAAMRSFAIESRIRRATEHLQRNRIPSTPSIVVNGKYLVRGRTYDDMLRIASFLIEREHGG